MLSRMEEGIGNRDKHMTADLWHHFRVLEITFRLHRLSIYFNPRDAYLQRGGSTAGTPDVLESGSGTMFDMHLSPFYSTQAIIVDVAAVECGVMIDRACEIDWAKVDITRASDCSGVMMERKAVGDERD
jgi:hypothetical protein